MTFPAPEFLFKSPQPSLLQANFQVCTLFFRATCAKPFSKLALLRTQGHSLPMQTWTVGWEEQNFPLAPAEHSQDHFLYLFQATNCSLVPFSNMLNEEALFHFRAKTSSASTCFSSLSHEERAEKIELWESSGRQLWFQLPAVTQLQRDRKVRGSMLNRRLFTWLGGGDDQPLIKHRLLESAGHAIGTGMLIENSRRGAAAFDFSTQLGITSPATEKAVLGQKSCTVRKNIQAYQPLCLAQDISLTERQMYRNISLYLLFQEQGFMSCLFPFNWASAWHFCTQMFYCFRIENIY